MNVDNAKPCGGAIPVCMVEEFSLPSEIIDRKGNIYSRIIEYIDLE